jgi:cell division protein FtsZ
MAEMGTAMMGTGEASGPNRALDAAHGAITNPLLDIISMKGARGVLINITGGYDMTLYEVDAAANEIRAEVDPQANIILGSTFDETMEGSMRVSVVATGIDDEAVVTQNTVVPNARRASDGYAGPMAPRRGIASDSAGSFAGEARRAPDEPFPAFEDSRPSFAREELDAGERRKGGGFSLFGWMGGKAPPEPPPREVRRPAPEPKAEEADEALDEELEIPAFLRRQMTQR